MSTASAGASSALDAEEFPVLATAVGVALDRDALFEYGLQRMLDGMRAQVAARKETAANGPAVPEPRERTGTA